MVVGVRRLRALAIASQIGRYYGGIAREARADRVPHDVRLWVAVQEQQWWTATAVPNTDLGLARVDRRQLETFEHSGTPLATSSARVRLSPHWRHANQWLVIDRASPAHVHYVAAVHHPLHTGVMEERSIR
jgi:hypothetical protein